MSFKTKKSKVLALLALVLCIGVPITAYALVGRDQLNLTYRTKEWCQRYQQATPALVAVGEDGVVVASTLNAVTSVNVNYLDTTRTVGDLPYPVKLLYDVADNPDDDTPSCATVTVSGIDQFGRDRRETMTAVNETAQTGSVVWGQVRSVVATGCAGATDAGDLLWIAASSHIGLRADVRDYLDVEAVCIMDAMTNYRCMDRTDGTASDLESDVDAVNDSVFVADAGAFANNWTIATAADLLCLRTRPR